MDFLNPTRALSNRSVLASSSAWIPLLYDTIIFVLTLYRTVPPIRREEASYILKRLLEDGLLYYRSVDCLHLTSNVIHDVVIDEFWANLFFEIFISAIFSVTCVLTFMIVAAPPGTKNIAAQ